LTGSTGFSWILVLGFPDESQENQIDFGEFWVKHLCEAFISGWGD
jgi:hypothetical protein